MATTAEPAISMKSSISRNASMRLRTGRPPRWIKTADLTGVPARPGTATRARPRPRSVTPLRRRRTLPFALRPAARLGVAVHDEHPPALDVDDVRASVGASAQPEIEAAPEPLHERDVSVAVEIAERARHLAVPGKLHRAHAGEEEEGDREDQDESQKTAIALQDSTR